MKIKVMGIHIHIHHHISADSDVIKRLDSITKKLDEMATAQERLDQAIANLNEGTNEIAADLQKLKDEIAAGKVSDESLATLEANIQVLQQLGTQQ